MSKIDRILRDRLATIARHPRSRTRTAMAGVALAVVAGLAAPAAASVAKVTMQDPASPTNPVAVAKAANELNGHPTKANKAKTAKPKKKKKKANTKAAPPSTKKLHPRGITASQTSFNPSKAQVRNAEAIIKTGQKMGLPPRAWVIAVATSLQESTLHNYGNLGDRNDHDSQGLFQQRPSSGWGSPKQITNPQYASRAFYKSLTKVDGWKSLPLTAAAQSVQVSAFPDHYAKWEKMAGDLVRGSYGSGPYAQHFTK